MWTWIFLFFFFRPAEAFECALTIERTPCLGQEKETLAPYNGKRVTHEVYQVKSETECAEKATGHSRIVRQGTLAFKKIQASFNGAAIAKKFEGKTDCKPGL